MRRWPWPTCYTTDEDTAADRVRRARQRHRRRQRDADRGARVAGRRTACSRSTPTARSPTRRTRTSTAATASPTGRTTARRLATCHRHDHGRSPVNDAPVAVRRFVSDQRGHALTSRVGVLGERHRRGQRCADGGARVSGPAHGALLSIADGSFTYTPPPTSTAATASPTGQRRRRRDSRGDGHVSVTAVNDAPIAGRLCLFVVHGPRGHPGVGGNYPGERHRRRQAAVLVLRCPSPARSRSRA